LRVDRGGSLIVH